MSGFVPDDGARSHIVIAEDDDATRNLLKRQLERADYVVTACPDGRAAFEVMREGGECILIVDWSMPEMDGLELCKAVRELQAMRIIQSVHIILLTANSDKDEIVQGLEAGADDYLTKPYHLQELLARLRAGERAIRLMHELYSQRLEVQKANAMLQVMNDKFEKLASTDVLTGLYNRRVLFERLSEAWAQSERSGEELGCIMLDIDYFKKINDTRGHQSGDTVLTELAKLIRAQVRPYDVCGRFGGEEFMVICPGAKLDAVCVVGERIRCAVEQHVFNLADGPLSVSVSVGVANRSERHNCPDALVSESDARLYDAKHNGRNQVWYTNEQRVGARFEPAPANA